MARSGQSKQTLPAGHSDCTDADSAAINAFIGPAALSSSFRDPSGFVFKRDGVLLRQVNASYREHFEQAEQSGLFEMLQSRNLLIPHEDVTETEARSGEGSAAAFRILRPEPLAFIAYPYEWCFSQWKDAALATLEIQKVSLEHGMTLKDASAYNIQFRGGAPLLIDTLSFEKWREGEPWVAYRQFCQHFLAPLALMAHTDIRLGNLLRVHLDGVPLDLASRLLPWRTRWNPALFAHLHLHASSQKKYANRPAAAVASGSGQRGGMTRTAMRGLIDSLEAAIRGLNWAPQGTVWANYYSETNYTDPAMDAKVLLVRDFLHTVTEIEGSTPRSVWDLGANTGRFSRIASEQGIFTVAWDFDPAAVEQGFREVRKRGDANLLPLVQDLTNPSPEMGWAHQERSSLLARGPADAVFALALIHHLAISNHVPLARIAEFFHQAGRWLIIEFVPPEDSQAQRLLNGRDALFPQYHRDGFEAAFGRYWETVRRETVAHDSSRIVYLMRARAPRQSAP